ncbi:MAG: Fic family protein [Lentimicrobiaceae bacterium]|nr:Fic family protein [Lentimicrobiaceae bacterium]
MLDNNTRKLLEYIRLNPLVSSKEIHEKALSDIGYSTVKRLISNLIKEGLIEQQGNGKASRYQILPSYTLFAPIEIDEYFSREIDERKINESFNFALINDILPRIDIFSDKELVILNQLQQKFDHAISILSKAEYLQNMERLAIDLSWKSSQIEGNTYSLLETERLLKERETADGKTKEEAVMLLNHKMALDFILQEPDYLKTVSISKIESINSLLINELGVDRNIRMRRVSITGTNYRPLDNEFQIREALNDLCDLINTRKNIFEKALLALLLLSYIQAFSDGNKRTARIVSNALLVANGYCPLSFRTVSSIDYKKAMLLFYEQNNISAFKRIFIEQYKFAVETYF